MASPSSHYTSFLLLFLFFFIFIFSSTTPSTALNHPTKPDNTFEKWVAWNVENHRRRSRTAAQLTTQLPAGGGGGGGGRDSTIDWKLRNAELKRVQVTVSGDGSGDYRSIGEAVAAIPPFNSKRVVVLIKPGVYREKVIIPRTLSFVTFLGDAADPPTITGNDTASVMGKGGAPLRTFQSATVGVDANYFIAVNIKFENTAPHEIGVKGEQAVALRISGTKAAFYNCSFVGSQDTLYDHKGLHYFNNCFIQGSVDFIFGYGRSLYENCYLNSVAKKVASLTAQKRTEATMASGFSFKNSTVTGTGRIYLGRAWGDYSTVVFSYTFMDKTVISQGWSDWGKPLRDGRVYYGEYKCSGPGANVTGRVPWARTLSDEEAQPFIGTYYIDGDTWLISP